MTRRVPALAVAAVLLAAAPIIAGCGSSYGSGHASTAAKPAASATTVKTASGSLGTILVGPGGRTIYLFEKDSGPHSTCSGACLAQWPAVTTHGRAQASGGASAALLGVTKRGDGTTQVTYAGHPLYYYAGDGAAGDANGQGIDAFGAKWYVMAPGGAAIVKQASAGGGGSGGYGGGY
jgi:predicted lipoprotein with Yx(FWY)xxD motif